MAEVGGSTRKRAIVVPAIVSKKKQQTVPNISTWKRLNDFMKLSPEEQTDEIRHGFLESGDEEGHCVASDITQDQFLAKCDELEKNGHAKSFSWEFKDGKAWIYETPKAPHEDAASTVHDIVGGVLGLQNVLGFRTGVLGLQNVLGFRTGASPTCGNPDIGASGLEPDGSFTKRGPKPGAGNPGRADASGNRWPNLIIEAAMSESGVHVRNKAIRWLSEGNHPDFGVKQVIAINIGDPPRRGTRTNGTRSMNAWRHEQQWTPALGALFATLYAAVNPAATQQERAIATAVASKGLNEVANPVQSADFGIPSRGPGNGATAVGQMVLRISMASLYHPLAVPAGLPATVDVDLHHIKVAIEDAE